MSTLISGILEGLLACFSPIDNIFRPHGNLHIYCYNSLRSWLLVDRLMWTLILTLLQFSAVSTCIFVLYKICRQYAQQFTRLRNLISCTKRGQTKLYIKSLSSFMLITIVKHFNNPAATEHQPCRNYGRRCSSHCCYSSPIADSRSNQEH